MKKGCADDEAKLAALGLRGLRLHVVGWAVRTGLSLRTSSNYLLQFGGMFSLSAPPTALPTFGNRAVKDGVLAYKSTYLLPFTNRVWRARQG